MKKWKSLLAMAVVALAPMTITACERADVEQEEPTELQSTEGNANQEEVMALLHEQRLITVPEVKAQSDHFIQQYRSGEMTREEAAQALRRWIENWVRENPEKAAAAAESGPRAQPNQSPAPSGDTAPEGQ